MTNYHRFGKGFEIKGKTKGDLNPSTVDFLADAINDGAINIETDAWLEWVNSQGVNMGNLLLLGFINQCRDEGLHRIVGLFSYDDDFEAETRQFYKDNDFEIKEFNGTEYVVCEF